MKSRVTTRGARLRDHLTEVLERRWRKYTAEVRRCQREFSSDAVHDLRVSIRRLVATLDFLRTILPEDSLRKMRRDLKRVLQTCSPLRDVQVQMFAVAQLVATYPFLQPLYTDLALRERKLIKRAAKVIGKVNAETHAETVVTTKRLLARMLRTRDAASQKYTGLMATALARFATAIQMKELTDPSRPETVHRLRVAFKKFRYTVEMLQPFLPGITRKQLKALNAYQVRMGDIQDGEVLAETIKRYLLKRSPREQTIHTPLLELLARKQTDCMQAFLNGADELYTFWRGIDKPTSERLPQPRKPRTSTR